MYGEDGIFTRQGEAAFSIWGEAGQKTGPPVTATLPPEPHVRNVDGLESPVPMAKSIYSYSERRASAVSEKDNNTREDAVVRGEHQHFWGNDGDNFGLMGENMGIIRGDGVIRSDDGHTLDEYKKDIPGLGTRKFKGAYIRMARDMLQNEYKEYNLLTNNCQDYVDEVIALAGILAEKNNDTLEINE